MPKETTIDVDVEARANQIRQNQEAIDQLKQEIKQLRTELGLSEIDEFEAQLNTDEVFEFGTLGNGVIKGKINWMTPYLISITISEDASPAEILVFKHALAYIRKPEETSISRRGMYI